LRRIRFRSLGDGSILRRVKYKADRHFGGRFILLKEMRYKTINELRGVVSRFEDLTMGRKEWGHPEHLIVAYFYSRENSLETAYLLMKRGIFRLLSAFGVDLTKEMPYHETLTVFWITAVHNFASTSRCDDDLESCAVMIEELGKDLPLRYYSRDLLFSDTARAGFVPPDLHVPEDDPVPAALRPLAVTSRLSRTQDVKS
jgi:hypothetical protein